jgi:hypothetical protein
MKQQTKHSEKQDHSTEQQSQQLAARQFKDADELLRFDAAQVVVPPEVARRLQKSAGQFPAPTARPWWKNLLGG